MSPKKYYFDEPLVRVSLARARFPKICPVCGAPTTATTRYTVETGRKQYLLRSWDPYYSPSFHRRQGMPTPNLNQLQINVCEKHYYSDEGEYRYKSLCFVTDGLAIAFLVFGLMFIGDAISRGRAIPFWAMVFIYFFILSMIASAVAFRPNRLLRAVKIVGFDPGMQYVLLSFESQSYREAFIKENPMNSELVSWILKADS